MTTNDTRPLSERLAEIADLPSIGINLTLERRTAIAEAVEMMKRVEAAPVGNVIGSLGEGDCTVLNVGMDDLPDPSVMGCKRVALVEIPND